MQSAVVLEGVSRTRNALINGDYKNYDWDSGIIFFTFDSLCTFFSYFDWPIIIKSS
jgi:hypothetical protein